ncbi:MAG TPA: phage terminase large subunit family protein [Thermomicrobiales bacterium]|jgi:ribosomal protein S27E
MGDKVGRRRVSAAMEAESREWLVRCPACGHEQSIWDLGGVRYKARGTKKTFLRCPNCRSFGWHTVYRANTGVQLAPLRPARPLWWHIGVLVGMVLLFLVLLGGVLFVILRSASAGPRDATSGYFAAVGAGDWASAHDRLSAAQRNQVTPGNLAASWGIQERAHGPVAGFDTTSFSIKNGRARISGKLRYRDGTTESRVVQLVREGGSWKIVSVQ